MVRNGTVYARVKDMNRAVWEYVRFVSQATNKTIPAVIEEMAEHHAKGTGRQALLDTFKEEFDHKAKS